MSVDREVIVLRAIVQSLEDADGTLMTWDELIKHTCEFGHCKDVHPDEVADVLVKSVQCIALPRSEWG